MIIRSLMEHENGHKEIAIQAAEKIENLLLNSYAPSEKTLKKAAKFVARGGIEKKLGPAEAI